MGGVPCGREGLWEWLREWLEVRVEADGRRAELQELACFAGIGVKFQEALGAELAEVVVDPNTGSESVGVERPPRNAGKSRCSRFSVAFCLIRRCHDGAKYDVEPKKRHTVYRNFRLGDPLHAYLQRGSCSFGVPRADLELPSPK